MAVSGQPWNKNSGTRIAEPVVKEPIIHSHTPIWPIKNARWIRAGVSFTRGSHTSIDDQLGQRVQVIAHRDREDAAIFYIPVD